MPLPSQSVRLPLWLKLGYTAFLAVLVPVYWYHYGPTNFLYFCDVALLLALAAVWLESPLLASIPAVGILVPQTLWCVDFVVSLCGGSLLGMTDYMFHDHKPLFLRALSFFHYWLPFLLLFLLWRLGYDRRAFWIWSVVAVALFLICYFLLPAPPAPPDNRNLPVNVNYVHGMSDDQPQTWMPPLAYLAVLCIGWPLLIAWPTHWVLQRVFRAAPASSS